MENKKNKNFPFNYASKSELRGFIIITVILIALSSVKLMIRHHENVRNPNQILSILQRFHIEDSLHKIIETKNSRFILDSLEALRVLKKTHLEKTALARINPFHFDPNNVTKPELLTMGLNDRQINGFINFRNSGARFYKPSDLNRVYAFNQKVCELLIPYVIISSNHQSTKTRKIKNLSALQEKQYRTSQKKTVKDKLYQNTNYKIDINSADTNTLMRLPLIGPYRAKMIYKYRALIGGFASSEQLLDAYGMHDTILAVIYPYITIDPSDITKISLNNFDIETIKSNPLLWDSIGFQILNLRRNIGSFQSIEQLKLLRNPDTMKLNRLIPYLKLN